MVNLYLRPRADNPVLLGDDPAVLYKILPDGTQELVQLEKKNLPRYRISTDERLWRPGAR